MIASKFIEAL